MADYLRTLNCKMTGLNRKRKLHFEFVTVIHPQDNKYINYRQEIMKAEKGLP
jgi:hypothetical protein